MRWNRRPPGSNWGDYGPDDELGKLNLLTPATRREALREASEGLCFSLSLPLDYPGGSDLVPSRRPPMIEASIRATGDVSYNYPFSRAEPWCCDITSDDRITIWTQYSTQWDSLAHWGQEFDADGDGVAEMVYYNGWRAGQDILGPDDKGGPFARHLGLEHASKNCIQGRGVLVDLEREFGREPVLVGYDALMRVLDRQRTGIEPGDILCIYTGWADLVLGMNKQPDFGVLRASCASFDGRDKALLDWVARSGVVAICADNPGVEGMNYVKPIGPMHKQSKLPLHELCLFKQGILLGEMWHLGELATWMRAHDRSRFLLTAPPLRLPGTVGSPATPVATV
jgi:kynurenine formamidase